jgi:hypothetical protein
MRVHSIRRGSHTSRTASGAGRRRVMAMVAVAALATGMGLAAAAPAGAAKSDGCEGGGYQLVNLASGTVVAAGPVTGTVRAAALGDRFGVRGRYVQFDVRASDFAVLDYAFTGAANAEDMTGGRFTPVWASKVPDLRGSVLRSDVSVEISAEDMVIARSGGGASIKIQAKDCATGGIFQMEPQRSDGQRTRFVHTLATSADPALTPFFFDNPNFRAVVGQFLGDDCVSVVTGPPSRFCVQGRTRVNIANDFSPDFVARDSAQVAERVDQPACTTATPVDENVAHCGGVSIWDVASGGRMGFVTGEDAVELSNPPTDCVQNCQAQNRVRGRLAVLDFPFPVPAGSRLTPRSSAAPLPPVLAPPSPSELTPPAPRLRAATSGSRGGRVTATARWRGPAGVVAGTVGRYQVRAIRVGRHGAVLAVKVSPRLASSARSRTMSLTRGAYRFQVRSVNAAGASAWTVRSNKVRAR